MGVGPVKQPFKRNLTTDGPISPGEVSESLVNQPLSGSPLCLFTATTVTGSGVGGADKKATKKGEKRSHRDSWWLLFN